MLDYYGDIPGPNKEDAKKQIYNSIKNETYLKYINEQDKEDVVKNIIEENYTVPSSYSGWCVFHAKDLKNKCLKELKEINKKKLYLKIMKRILNNKLNNNNIEDICRYI